jgi:broad specificity phosphatase PhoE
MKIIIARHGQTDENIGDGIAVRSSEILLNSEGIKQAERLGDYLKSYNISHAYSSPLRRAVQTTNKILQYHQNAKFLIADHLIEQNLGVAETMPKSVWKEIKKNSLEPWHLFKAENGESYTELQNRSVNFFNGLVSNHSDNDTVLIVSHGGPLGVLMLHILEKPLTEENYKVNQPHNTEFSILEIFSGGAKKIHKINSREHLI